MSPTTVPMGQLAPAMVWLRQQAEVPIGRLAVAFGITPNYVRQLLYRGRQIGRDQAAPGAHVISACNTRQLGFRREEDSEGASEARDRNIDALRERSDHIYRTLSTGSGFLEGARQLKGLQQFIGFPSTHAWMRLRSELHQRRAWFLVHTGHVSSAIEEAELAIASANYASRQARYGRDARADLKIVMDAALIASHANLLRQTPHEALGWLEDVEDASEAGGLRVGSDYYRQRGVYLFQIGEDTAAHRYFDKSREIMEELRETGTEAELRYTGPRHSYLLRQDWTAAVTLVLDAQRDLSELHASVATHWAVAAGLSTDSPQIQIDALSLLHRTPQPGADFGHQRTLRFLFERTPELGLDLAARRRWVRYALYVNAYRND
jgi:hypothetical protein